MEDLWSFLPVLIFIVFWIFIMFRLRKGFKSNNFTAKQDEMLSVLKEIKEELKELNKNNSDKKL